MIDIKLCKIQIVAAVIVIVVGFFFIGCFPKQVQVSILSISNVRSYDQKIDQKGLGHSTSVPVNPTVDKKLKFSPTLDLMP